MGFDHAAFRVKVESILAKIPGIRSTCFDECFGTTFVDVIGTSGYHVVLQGFPDGAVGVSLRCEGGAFLGADHVVRTDDQVRALIESILCTGTRYPALSGST